MELVNDAQIWTLIGVFAAIMLGGMTLMTTLITRSTSSAIDDLDKSVNARIDGLEVGTNARFDKLESGTNARFERLGDERSGTLRQRSSRDCGIGGTDESSDHWGGGAAHIPDRRTRPRCPGDLPPGLRRRRRLTRGPLRTPGDSYH